MLLNMFQGRLNKKKDINFVSAQNRTVPVYLYNLMELKFNDRSTKVQQLSDFIEDAIASNEFKEGDQLPSINDLSKQFKVSRDTVFKSFSDLKNRGIIDSIHGKNYHVVSKNKDILLLLDEYSPFKEVLYNVLSSNLPKSYKIDLWFHQYNQQLFENIINGSAGKFSKYLIMNYDNDIISDALLKIDKKNLLLLDFGNFDKEGYSYVCQDFNKGLYNALNSIKDELTKYKKLILVFNKYHKHPLSSKIAFREFCTDNKFEFDILDKVNKDTILDENYFYLVIKQQDVINLIKLGKDLKWKPGVNYGILAYNENSLFEVIENGISSVGIDWKEMGNLAADFVMTNEPIRTFLPTVIVKRDSF